jgi:hypothetical protein
MAARSQSSQGWRAQGTGARLSRQDRNQASRQGQVGAQHVALQDVYEGNRNAQQASQNEQTARHNTLGDLYAGLDYSNRDPGTGQLINQQAAMANPGAGNMVDTAQWQSAGKHADTNINNIWWRNFMASAGSSTGQAMGSAAGGGMGMLGG